MADFPDTITIANVNQVFSTLVEKNLAEASPKIGSDKKETLSNLQNMIDSIHEKSKEKSVIDTWPTKPPVDQPDYYDAERSVNYD